MLHIISVSLSYNPYLCLSFKLPLSLFITILDVSRSNYHSPSFKLPLSLYQCRWQSLFMLHTILVSFLEPLCTYVCLSIYLCMSFKLPLSLSGHQCVFFKLPLSLYQCRWPCIPLHGSHHTCLSLLQPYLCLSVFQTTSVSLSNNLCLSFKLPLSVYLTTSVCLSNYHCLSI